jgi:UDP-N-acetylmuramate dehydrogenase
VLHSSPVLIHEHVPLAPLTTFGIGGPARYLVEPATADDLGEAIAFARECDLPMFVLGGGSNLLVADEGFAGVVIKVALRGIEVRKHAASSRSEAAANSGSDGRVSVVSAGAGEDWDALVAYVVERNLAGFECMSGIPGTVGATPVQNVGAYGQEVSSTIVDVEALDLSSCELRTFSNAECGFNYRTSVFNTTARDRYIITRVSFELRPGGAVDISYRDLKQHFGESTPTLAETRAAVLAIREAKGMLNPHLPKTGRWGAPSSEECLPFDGQAPSGSAGSFFKNPVLSESEFAEFERRAARLGLTVPNYPALSSQRKIPAAWLIEQAGFHKGFADGPVGISSHHALAIVNRGGARAADVLRLKERIQRGVFDQFGIRLQLEPVLVGFETQTSACVAPAADPAR